jgi:hypothetical protein
LFQQGNTNANAASKAHPELSILLGANRPPIDSLPEDVRLQVFRSRSDRKRARPCKPNAVLSCYVFLSALAFPALLAQLAEQLTLNQRVVGSSPTGGISVNSRRDTTASGESASLSGFLSSSAQEHSTLALRQEPTDNDDLGSERPPRATAGATDGLPNDPDLTLINEAWHTLPEALRAGILAMVKAATPKQGGS